MKLDLFYFIYHTKNIGLPMDEKLLLETIVFLKIIQCLPDKDGYIMKHKSVIKSIVNDLLSSDEYSVDGLAHYTGYPIDVIFDVASGINTNPTIHLCSKIVELHVIARKDLYRQLSKKIIEQLSES